MAETKHRAGLTSRQKEVLEFIDENLKDKGYPPSVREIEKELNMKYNAKVQNNITTIESKGFLKRDPTKPRAIEMSYESGSGAIAERRPVKHIPLIGSVSAGTGVLADQTIDESYPLPEDFTGDGVLFMLKVRGESMIDAGIFDGDYVVVRQQNTANSGDIVVAGINDDEATIKTFIKKDRKIILRPSNPSMSDVVLKEYNLKIFGKVVTVLRRI